MRISDWSSDVCSSDLGATCLMADLRTTRRRQQRERLRNLLIERQRALRAADHQQPCGAVMCKALRRWRQFGKARAYRIAHRFAIAECVWERLQDAARDARETTVGQACRCVQIGRASCRERVCQYV